MPSSSTSNQHAPIGLPPAPSDALARQMANAETDRQRRHADAQARYHEKRKARERMQRLRATRALSEDAKQRAAEQRREVDADYCEHCRKHKFIKKFGHHAFIDFYLPLHQVCGPHILGKQFLWSDEPTPQGRKPPKARGTKASRGAAAAESG
ncbi:hypothetical protein DFH08DRAFT_974330 [Mycena albidolilacea]|uniref:Uncharacterized protein n=1 Tax=Mycena albidolilacea TaxID=1033008 RepID=A0AAD7ECH8_9AGAR|nr:hypothetical protein DFH08DRAFT_974330 [Mycena albidolilacea]